MNIFFKTMTVETDVGTFIEKTISETSYAFDSVSIDIKDRGFGKQKFEKNPDGTTTSTTTSYIEFNIFSSNKQDIYTRKYAKIINVLSDVGGIAEVIAFLSIFVYAWYNSIKMEQKLLNYGVLNKTNVDEHERLLQGGGQLIEQWEEDRYFSFWDLVIFGFKKKGLGCCFGRDEKYTHYKRTVSTFEDRTDVIQIMKTVSDVDSMREIMLDDYQLRLMPYLANVKDDTDANIR